MGIKTVPQPPYSPHLVPVIFGYSLSSEAVVMGQLRRWKKLWRRSLTLSHKRTSMGPSRRFWNGRTSALQPEEISSKGLVFHVCTINKSAHTKKVWKLILWSSYIYIYIYDEWKSNPFSFSTGIIIDTGTCIIHQNEAGPHWITSLLLNIVTVSLNSNVPSSNESMHPCLVKFYSLFFKSDHHRSFHFLVTNVWLLNPLSWGRRDDCLKALNLVNRKC